MAASRSRVILGDLLVVKHGFAFQGEHFRDEPTTDVLLTPGNFAIGGGFKDDKYKYYAGPIPEAFVLKDGDLVVTMTDLSKRGDTLGYPAIVPHRPRVRFLHNQRIGRVEITAPDRLDKNYLYYLLRTEEYRHEVLSSATGSTVRHTSPSRICAFSFELPSLSQQRALAAVLGALDDRINVNRSMNQTLEALLQTVFRSWFVEFEPVKVNAKGHTPQEMDAEMSALFPRRLQESEVGPIPAGWRVVALDQIAQFLNGLALQKFPPREGEPYLAVVKIAQLRSGTSDGSDRANTDVPAEYIVDDGDLLFSWSGSLLVRIWTGGRGALNQHLFKVKCDSFPRWFVRGWLGVHLPEFQAIAAGKATTMGHIQRHHLTDAKVVAPPAELLGRIGQRLANLEGLMVRNEVQNRTLVELRDLLLPKLISGELRVKDAEAVIAASA